MSANTPLVRPAHYQVKIEPTAKSPASDGFAYPAFRLLNKQARTAISNPYELSSTTHYHLLAVANSKGWFAAARFNGSSYELVLSPLEDLRSAAKAAKVGSDNSTTLKRTLSLTQSKPNILTFACQDSCLVVGLEVGTVLIYDTVSLFTSGQDQISPTHTAQLQTSALKQIVPNPGSEANLVDRIAIVGDGFVQIFNMQLEPQGGWSASDSSTVPAAVAWSPKGKHIAIGLQTGDVLTFSLTNMATSHKHIPPTFDGSLVSLSWTGPGHTFRISYASSQEPSNPALHIMSLDTRSNTGTYYSLTHPFVSGDRSFQSSYLLQLPKWDEDASSSDHSKALLVFGDSTSIDLEVLAHDGGTWYQQSQENPLSLPLNKDMDDTILLSLDLDLTETSTSTPIAYAYLNDGTLQAWYLEHSKPYPLIVSSNSQLRVQAPDAIQTDTSMSTEQDQAKAPTPAFTRPSSTFGQPSFGGSSAFGATSAFGQLSTGSTGFSAFSSVTPAPFGQAVPQQSSTASPFSATTTPAPPFGTFGGNSPFGSSSSSNAFSSSTGAFGSYRSSNAPAFGQTGFGNNTTTSAFGSGALTTPGVDMTREASMADDTPAFAGLSLSSSNADSTPPKSSVGIFGSSNSGTTITTSSFGTGSGSVIKPATAFGAYANNSPFNKTDSTTGGIASAFGQVSQAAPALAPVANTNSGFGKSGFGQTSFSQPSLSQPAFGQPAFGQSSFGSAPASISMTTTGGFSGFANKPASFTTAPQGTASAFGGGGGGFNAFAGSNTGGFTSALKSVSADVPTPSQATGSGTETSPFQFTGSAFSNPQFTATPVFGGTSMPSTSGTPKPPPGISSPPSSPEPTLVKSAPLAADASLHTPSPFKTSQPPVTTGAFANLQTSPSAFRPASGFNAFGSSSPSESSPFFKKPEQKAPVSVFATLTSSGASSNFASPASPTLSSKPTTTPTFGTPSLLGAQKSLFPPPTPPSPTPAKSGAGAFSAFSGPPATLTALSAHISSSPSFTDLLKTGEGFKDTTKPSAKDSDKPELVFGGVGKDSDTTIPSEDKGESDWKPSSQGTLVADASFGKNSSAGSSFVDVRSEDKPVEKIPGGAGEDRDETRSISSEDYGSDESYEPRASDEELSDDHIYDEGDESHEEDEEAEEGEEGDDVEDEDGGGESRSPSPEPTTVPLPPSRSSSATPQPEVPNIRVTPTGEKSGSTTPPGTPEKDPDSLPRKSPSPSPVSGSVTPAPFGIGLGRPSTRPTRSSPLASAPLSGDDEEEGSQKSPSATPELVAALPPVKVDAPEAEPTEAGTLALGPKTLAMPKTPVLAHAKPPARPVTVPHTLGVDKPVAAPSPHISRKTDIFGQAAKASSNIPTGTPSSSFFSDLPPAKSPALPVSFDITRPASQPPQSNSFILPSKSHTSPPDKGSAPSDFSTFNLTGVPSSKPSAPLSSFFGSSVPAAPPSHGPPFPRAPSPFFGNQNFKITPQCDGSLFESGGFSLVPKPPSPAASALIPSPALPPPPEFTMEEGMQKECALLIMSLNKELEELRLRAQQMDQRRQHLGKSVGGSWNRPDLGDPAKWSLGDVKQFGQVLAKFGKDLTALKELRDKTKQAIHDLNSSMLKAGTRREEIARFNKAKTDPEFARMLRTRTLGPEHCETQTQLRRGIRTMRDRITKLESNLQASKKKLAESVSGRPSIKAPTLDTVNRTFRNIEIALSQQADDVAKLVSRLEALDLDRVSMLSTPVRDSRLPDRGPRRPYNVTPNVAATTAAALNAERGAHRLKKALLAARKEPLLNVTVYASKPPPVGFTNPESQKTPQRPAMITGGFAPVTPFSFGSTLGGGVFTPPNASEISDSSFSLRDDDDFSPSASLPGGPNSRRDRFAKKHSTVHLPKRSPGSASSVAPSFDWGPLPSFNNSPLNSLAANFTKKS